MSDHTLPTWAVPMGRDMFATGVDLPKRPGTPDTSDRLRLVIERLSIDPYVIRRVLDQRRWLARGESGGPRVTTPSAVVGEQRLMALMVAGGEYRLNKVVAPGNEIPWREWAAKAMLVAPPVLWMNEIQKVAFAYNLPRHITGNWTLPHRAMWWTYESALPVVDAHGQKTGDVVDACLVVNAPAAAGLAPARLEIIRFGANAAGDPWVGHWRVEAGVRYPEDVRPIDAVILQCIAFMNSPYVSLKPEHSHKPDAKAKFRGRRIDPASMHVVMLRSEVHHAVAIEQGHDSPNWTRRWIVRGHYRAQWYPSTQTHKVIWVAPYLKGPVDAPLTTPTYVVAR